MPGRVYGTSAVAVAAGHTVLGGALTGELTLWDRGSAIGFSDRAVRRLALQPGGRLLATVAGDGSGWLWDRDTGARRPIGDGRQVDAAFSPDGSRLAVATERGDVQVWDVVTGAPVTTYSRPDLEPVELSFSPDGSTLAVAARARAPGADAVLVLRAADLAPQGEHTTGVDHPLGVAFSPDGRQLAVPLESGRLAVLTPGDASAPRTVLAAHQGQVADAAFAPDGRLLATAGGDGVVRLWSVPDARPVAEFPVGQPVRALAFSPDGAVLAAAGLHQRLQLWDLPGRRPLAELDQVDTAVNDVLFDPDGHLLSGYADGWVSTWELDPVQASGRLCHALAPEPIAEQWRALGPDMGDPPGCPD